LHHSFTTNEITILI